MKRLKYQLKNIRRDKMCVLTFLLPIIVGIAVSLLSGVSLQTMSETSFGILKNDLSSEAAAWLKSNGCVTEYETMADLHQAVNNPSTQMIGVLRAGGGIRSFRSGDELEVNRVIADTLPWLYESRGEEHVYKNTVVPVSSGNDGLKSLLIVITLVTAMFMGCTFNAMNMITEKEDGVTFINRILPMTARSYLMQKILLGFIGGVLSTVLTALICMKLTLSQVVPLILIIILSAFISALAGLYIGHFSEGLMVGIVYIKMIMIIFLAPPIFFYLMVPGYSVLFQFSYLLPSSASFYGLMNMANGSAIIPGKDIVILAAHCIVWLLFYLFLFRRQKQ